MKRGYPLKNFGMTPQFTDARERGKRCTGDTRAAGSILGRILTAGNSGSGGEKTCDPRAFP